MTGQGPSKRVLDVCDELLALPESERESYLARACGEDPRLRASVVSVLRAIEEAGDFLDVPTATEIEAKTLEGRQIGSYHLTKKLGEGGMGAVYLAERREEDYSQWVAIKMVRGHLLARELIQRFHAERKLLARLNHPYIARMIDSGTTEHGVPYLVMEYVEGVPIDQFCDDNRLSIRDRLRLVRKVAMAVQSAHQNLIVHRDLKPTNVLVTQDGIPKLLDFGIAKLIEPDGVLESSATTVFGSQALTPDYASPEQILDGTVTTASDVYSLGVLSYQLLTGERPYHMDITSRRDLMRSVEKLTVPKPSSRLMTVESVEARAAIARSRATTLQRLHRSLKGDLDNILLKALRQEPERRYGSVASFSDDIERYLKGLPVEARTDGWRYRSGKFLRRNWLPVTAASLIAASLGAGVLAFAWQAREAQKQRDIAKAEASTAKGTVEFLKTVLWSANPFDSGDSETTISDVLRHAESELDELYEDRPSVKAYVLSAMAEIYIGRGEFEKAKDLSLATLEILNGTLGGEDPRAPTFYRIHANVLDDLGDFDGAIAALLESISRFEAQQVVDWSEFAGAYNQLGAVRTQLHQTESALEAYRTAIRIHEQHPIDSRSQLASIYNNMATVMMGDARLEEAIDALAVAERLLEEEESVDARLATMYANHAGVLTELGRSAEAEAFYLKAIELHTQMLGREHPEAVMAQTSLGQFYGAEGRYQEARAILEPALTAAEAGLPPGHPIIAYVQNVFGSILCESGDLPAGTALARSSVEIRKTLFEEEDHWAVASAESNLGGCLVLSGDFNEAERLLIHAVQAIGKTRGEDHSLTEIARERLRRLYRETGRPEKAEALSRAVPSD